MGVRGFGREFVLSRQPRILQALERAAEDPGPGMLRAEPGSANPAEEGNEVDLPSARARAPGLEVPLDLPGMLLEVLRVDAEPVLRPVGARLRVASHARPRRLG